MNESDESYRQICDEVWGLYQAQIKKDKWRRSSRCVMLPPPSRGRRVDILFVGISPSPVGGVGFARERGPAELLARDFEYVTGAGNGKPGFSNDLYYAPLLEFARRLSANFGVWPQVGRGEKTLLAEFTDALHVTTDHRIADDLLSIMNPQAESDPVCDKCKEILDAELRLYRPRTVVCNGRLPSKFVWELCTGRPVDRPVKQTMLKDTRFGCSVHFSGYLGSKWMDGFSRARLLREITENTDFGANG